MELEQNAAVWRKRGYEIAALSYDSPAVLKYFAEKRKLSYPLLSDSESKVIREFGILNEKIPEKNPFRGIPHPGTYLLDPSGKVLSKYFEDDYTERMTSAAMLVKEFGLDVMAGAPHNTDQTKHLRITSGSTATIVRPGQKITLSLDVELAKGMHVYAPGVSGYKQVAWTFAEKAPVKAQEATWPKAKTLYLKAIKEKAPVFEGRFRILREVTLANQRTLKPLLSSSGEFTLESEFFYQACDAKVCYVPQSVPVRWKLIVEGHDSERAPQPLRRPGM